MSANSTRVIIRLATISCDQKRCSAVSIVIRKLKVKEYVISCVQNYHCNTFQQDVLE